MLAHCLRRWVITNPTLVQRHVLIHHFLSLVPPHLIWFYFCPSLCFLWSIFCTFIFILPAKFIGDFGTNLVLTDGRILCLGHISVIRHWTIQAFIVMIIDLKWFLRTSNRSSSEWNFCLIFKNYKYLISNQVNRILPTLGFTHVNCLSGWETHY